MEQKTGGKISLSFKNALPSSCAILDSMGNSLRRIEFVMDAISATARYAFLGLPSGIIYQYCLSARLQKSFWCPFTIKAVYVPFMRFFRFQLWHKAKSCIGWLKNFSQGFAKISAASPKRLLGGLGRIHGPWRTPSCKPSHKPQAADST